MDSALDRDDSKVNRPGTLLALVQTVTGMVGQLLGFFALTEAERLKSGIHLGGFERDR